jgi:diguanylate cyclase (GGDEF)-like protein
LIGQLATRPGLFCDLTMPLKTNGFAAAVIDALSSHVCVIDRRGIIVAVNRAWREFGAKNGADPATSNAGAHYLGTCQRVTGLGGDEADDFAAGVRAVLERTTDLFELEYPCHSPNRFRWFLGRVTPLDFGEGGAVISHLDISRRKQLELDLAKLAATDPLTGLPNRRYFIGVAGREVERVRRFGAAVSIVMVDIDHFKAVNDTHGHAAGDEVLRRAMQVCRGTLRQSDVMARFGGEEFVGLLPDTDLAGAATVAESLRCLIKNLRVTVGAQSIGVTASFGVTQIMPGDQVVDTALGRADAALYAAKASGRNCVRCSIGSPSHNDAARPTAPV